MAETLAERQPTQPIINNLIARVDRETTRLGHDKNTLRTLFGGYIATTLDGAMCSEQAEPYYNDLVLRDDILERFIPVLTDDFRGKAKFITDHSEKIIQEAYGWLDAQGKIIFIRPENLFNTEEADSLEQRFEEAEIDDDEERVIDEALQMLIDKVGLEEEPEDIKAKFDNPRVWPFLKELYHKNPDLFKQMFQQYLPCLLWELADEPSDYARGTLPSLIINLQHPAFAGFESNPKPQPAAS